MASEKSRVKTKGIELLCGRDVFAKRRWLRNKRGEGQEEKEEEEEEEEARKANNVKIIAWRSSY